MAGKGLYLAEGRTAVGLVRFRTETGEGKDGQAGAGHGRATSLSVTRGPHRIINRLELPCMEET